jgi:hypothetical protein
MLTDQPAGVAGQHRIGVERVEMGLELVEPRDDRVGGAERAPGQLVGAVEQDLLGAPGHFGEAGAGRVGGDRLGPAAGRPAQRDQREEDGGRNGDQPGQDAERAEQDAGDDERAEQGDEDETGPADAPHRLLHLAPRAPFLRFLCSPRADHVAAQEIFGLVKDAFEVEAHPGLLTRSEWLRRRPCSGFR